MTFDQNSPNPKNEPASQMCLEIMQNIENFKNWLDEVIEDFKLNVLVKQKRDLDEKWKIAIVESLDVLVLDNFQNFKYLETWNKMLCSIYGKNLMVNKRHAYESCGKKKFK